MSITNEIIRWRLWFLRFYLFYLKGIVLQKEMERVRRGRVLHTLVHPQPPIMVRAELIHSQQSQEIVLDLPHGCRSCPLLFSQAKRRELDQIGAAWIRTSARMKCWHWGLACYATVPAPHSFFFFLLICKDLFI